MFISCWIDKVNSELKNQVKWNVSQNQLYLLGRVYIIITLEDSRVDLYWTVSELATYWKCCQKMKATSNKGVGIIKIIVCPEKIAGFDIIKVIARATWYGYSGEVWPIW